MNHPSPWSIIPDRRRNAAFLVLRGLCSADVEPAAGQANEAAEGDFNEWAAAVVVAKLEIDTMTHEGAEDVDVVSGGRIMISRREHASRRSTFVPSGRCWRRWISAVCPS